MITLTIKKKYVCYVADYLIENLNRDFFFVLTGLRQAFNNSNAGMEDNVSIQMDCKSIEKLFYGLGSRTEYLTARIHRELKSAVFPIIIQECLPYINTPDIELTSEQKEKKDLINSLMQREIEINSYEEERYNKGLEVLTN